MRLSRPAFLTLRAALIQTHILPLSSLLMTPDFSTTPFPRWNPVPGC
jgi:hypothetical protein